MIVIAFYICLYVTELTGELRRVIIELGSCKVPYTKCGRAYIDIGACREVKSQGIPASVGLASHKALLVEIAQIEA